MWLFLHMLTTKKHKNQEEKHEFCSTQENILEYILEALALISLGGFGA